MSILIVWCEVNLCAAIWHLLLANAGVKRGLEEEICTRSQIDTGD